MNPAEIFRTSMDSLRENPVRSFLTSLGVTAGVGAVVALVGLFSGVGGFVESQFQGMLNSNAFSITRQNPDFTDFEEMRKSRSWPEITLEDAGLLADAASDYALVSWEARSMVTVRTLSETAAGVSLTGSSAQSATVMGISVEHGRYFTEAEFSRGADVCVLGADLAETLELDADDLGSSVRVAGHIYTVVGIEEASGSAFGASMDSGIRIPFGSWQNRFGRPGTEVTITVVPLDGQDFDETLTKVEEAFRNIRGLTLSDESDFYTVTQEGAMSSVNALLSAASAVTIGIAAISLLVGGIGIMNITLVSVTERTREIGTRRALGATRGTIVAQFLAEAVSVSFLGGLIGLLLGGLVVAAVGRLTPLPAETSGWSVASALGFSSLVGLVFGVYPAWKASGLSPVEALRYE